jgi:hypothetical protein
MVFRLNDHIAAHTALNAFAKRTLRFFPQANERLQLAVYRERAIRSQETQARAELLTVNDLSPRALQVYLDLVAATTSRNETR